MRPQIASLLAVAALAASSEPTTAFVRPTLPKARPEPDSKTQTEIQKWNADVASARQLKKLNKRIRRDLKETLRDKSDQTST